MRPNAFSIEDLVARGEETAWIEPDTALAVAVIDHGEVIEQRAFGVCDRVRRDPVTTRTSFDIASLTKSMTATLFVQAHERKAIDLSSPVRDFGVALPPSAADATLIDLLAHRTGMPAHDFFYYFGRLSARDAAQRIALLETFGDAFRKVFIYNNLLYGCARVLGEERLARSWEAQLTDDLFGPLEMNATNVRPPGPTRAGEATPHVGERPILPAYFPSIIGAAGVWSTIEDLSRWALFQLGRGRLPLAESARRMLHDPCMSLDGISPLLLTGLDSLAPSAYGLGWMIGEVHGHRAVLHPGFTNGFSSVMALVPERAAAIVVVSNATFSAFPGVLAGQLIARLVGVDTSFPRPLQAERAAAPDIAASSIAPPSSVIGVYEHPGYGRLAIERHDAEHRLVYGSRGWPLRFTSEADASFVVEASGLRLTIPASIRDDRVTVPFALDARVPPQVFERIDRAETDVS